MFLSYNYKIINTSNILEILCDKYLSEDFVIVRYKNEDIEFVNGIEALNVIMALAPNVLEGKRGKYRKNAWAVHNLIGHPLMQILSWLSLKEAAVKVHDLTIPNLEEEQ